MSDAKEPWLNYLALTTVVLAVCATLSTFKGGGQSTRAVMSQNQASDQFAHYQAKSIKGYQYEMAKDRLELDLSLLGAKASPAVTREIQARIETYGKEVARYDREKAEIMKKAKAFEAARDDAKVHGQAFGLAVIFLQIAILLSSISALLKERRLWFLGGAVGAVGVLYFAKGFLLFTWLP